MPGKGLARAQKILLENLYLFLFLPIIDSKEDEAVQIPLRILSRFTAFTTKVYIV